ncbi:MAG TPA: hypothetical protein VI873_03255 [Candidatus Peribacteraceae bacterium]|nr:hypothetical protein [Candidatus Peribacteraceae bacterium]
MTALLLAPQVRGQEFGPPEPPSPRAVKKVEYLTPLPGQPTHPIVQHVLKDTDRRSDWAPAVKTRLKELVVDFDSDEGSARDAAQDESSLLLGSVIRHLENPIPEDVLSVLNEPTKTYEQRIRVEDVHIFVRRYQHQEHKRLSLKPFESDFEADYERRTGRKIAASTEAVKQRLLRAQKEPVRGKNTSAEFLLDLCNRTGTSLDYDRKTDTIMLKDGVAPAIPLGDFVLMKIHSNDGVVLFSLTDETSVGFGTKNLTTLTEGLSLLLPANDKPSWHIYSATEKPQDILSIPPYPPFSTYELDCIVAGSRQKKDLELHYGMSSIGFQEFWIQTGKTDDGYDVTVHIRFSDETKNGRNAPTDGAAFNAAATNRYQFYGKKGPMEHVLRSVDTRRSSMSVNFSCPEEPQRTEITAPTSLHSRRISIDMAKLRELVPPRPPDPPPEEKPFEP